jgi:NAD+ kinase
MEELKSNSLSLIHVSRLNATIHSVQDGKTVVSKPVLNDFLFTAANPAETSRYRITLGPDFEVQKSSGIWVATAAGSTAAISAAGGAVFPIDETGFQYMVREPFAAPGKRFKLVGGSFYLEQQKFELENLVDQGILALDGHHGIIPLGYGDRVVFGDAPRLKLARSI